MAQWQVSMSRVVAGRPDTISKTVEAPTQQEAIRRAQAGVPNATQYVQIVATQIGIDGELKIDQEEKGPEMQPQRPMMGQMAAEHFPFTMMLPAGYREIMEISVPNVKMARRNSRIYIEVQNSKDLRSFLKKLFETGTPKAKSLFEDIVNSTR